MKRISAMLLAFIIILTVVMPVSVHANGGGGSWTTTTSNDEFVAGMKAYSKAMYNINTKFSKIGYDDPITASIIEWSYQQWNKAANYLNIDLNTLQNHMRYRVSDNGALQFWYDGSYVQYFNALVERYLEANGLNKNTETFDKTIYSGKIFTDDDGNSCYCFILPNGTNFAYSGANNTIKTQQLDRYIDAYGSNLKYTNQQMYEYLKTNTEYNLSFNLKNNVKTITIYKKDSFCTFKNENTFSGYSEGTFAVSPNPTLPSGTTYSNAYGYPSIGYYDSKYYLISYAEENHDSFGNDKHSGGIISYGVITNGSALDAAIQIAKDGMPKYTPTPDNSGIIQAGKYGADVAKALTDYIDDNDPEEPQADPNVPDGGEPDIPDIPSGDDTLPGLSYDGKPFHFTMPDFSGFNWSISGLQDKFPFSIPFDMIDFFQVLDASPETPEFKVNVNIANVHVDETISLEVFDDYMPMFRNIILAGWCIFLIIATRSVFKVY